jgi:hypothetical protein
MGKVKPILVFIQPNRLAGVKDGLKYMQDGKVSATHVQFTYTICQNKWPLTQRYRSAHRN